MTNIRNTEWFSEYRSCIEQGDLQNAKKVLLRNISNDDVKREAPAYIANDGKLTPMRGHPVFIAQHATATCCRECIRKWHKMQPGKELSQVQQDRYITIVFCELSGDKLVTKGTYAKVARETVSSFV